MMTFKSQEEKSEALRQFRQDNQQPPAGTTDIDAWQADVDAKEAELEAAEINPDGEAPKPPEEPKPEAAPEEKQPEPPVESQTATDDVLEFKVKRSELPDVLRSYKDVPNILKQAEHARKYANQAEEALNELKAKVSSHSSENEALKQQIEELKKASQTAQTVVDRAPSKTDQKSIDDLNAYISDLEKLSDDDYAPVAPVKKALTGAIKQLNSVNDIVTDAVTKATSELDNKYQQKLSTLEQSVNGYGQSLREQQRQKQEVEARKNIVELQDKFPELKTTKPFNDVESNVVKFATAVATAANVNMPDPSRNNKEFWSYVNRIVNGYNEENKEILALMQQSGIQPENYGISGQDVTNYGIIVNCDAMVRGEEIDSVTGDRRERKNFLGKTISEDNHVSAYQKLLLTSGILQKKHDKERSDAEVQGQLALRRSEMKRDNAAEIIGTDGTANPEDIGQEITEELALEIIGAKRGAKTVDQEKMEILCMQGKEEGYQMFDILNKANRRLGRPEDRPEKDWLPRPVNA